MRFITVILVISISVPSYAKTICEKHENGKETCYRNPDVDLNGKYQERYDDYMRGAGKWDFISTSLYMMTLVSLGATYYSLDKAQKYRTLEKERELTSEEEKDFKKWDRNTKTAAGATGGLLIFGLIGHGIELHYERKAHTFAVEVGVSW